ncbi:MAG: lambda exonuclease family protein [Hyphomicrobium sp.]|uniref:lambda exonuclease family protein n=1 Tax=Hyphomicrobium sp. TaxID=82 RepID=UPI003566629D
MTQSELLLAQGSQEWLEARVGSLGASRVSEATAKTKTGFGASRANLLAELLVERLTGKPTDKFTTQAMQIGTEREPEARAAYCFMRDIDVQEVGLVRHPTIKGTHASPDGLVGSDGLIEIKSPQAAAHLDILLTGTIPSRYQQQMAWQMAVCDRSFCDFVSYNPDFPEHMRLFIKRVDRLPEQEAHLTEDVVSFLAELDAKLARLQEVYRSAA